VLLFSNTNQRHTPLCELIEYGMKGACFQRDFFMRGWCPELPPTMNSYSVEPDFFKERTDGLALLNGRLASPLGSRCSVTSNYESTILFIHLLG